MPATPAPLTVAITALSLLFVASSAMASYVMRIPLSAVPAVTASATPLSLNISLIGAIDGDPATPMVTGGTAPYTFAVTVVAGALYDNDTGTLGSWTACATSTESITTTPSPGVPGGTFLYSYCPEINAGLRAAGYDEGLNELWLASAGGGAGGGNGMKFTVTVTDNTGATATSPVITGGLQGY